MKGRIGLPNAVLESNFFAALESDEFELEVLQHIKGSAVSGRGLISKLDLFWPQPEWITNLPRKLNEAYEFPIVTAPNYTHLDSILNNFIKTAETDLIRKRAEEVRLRQEADRSVNEKAAVAAENENDSEPRNYEGDDDEEQNQDDTPYTSNVEDLSATPPNYNEGSALTDEQAGNELADHENSAQVPTDIEVAHSHSAKTVEQNTVSREEIPFTQAEITPQNRPSVKFSQQTSQTQHNDESIINVVTPTQLDRQSSLMTERQSVSPQTITPNPTVTSPTGSSRLINTSQPGTPTAGAREVSQLAHVTPEFGQSENVQTETDSNKVYVPLPKQPEETIAATPPVPEDFNENSESSESANDEVPGGLTKGAINLEQPNDFLLNQTPEAKETILFEEWRMPRRLLEHLPIDVKQYIRQFKKKLPAHWADLMLYRRLNYNATTCRQLFDAPTYVPSSSSAYEYRQAILITPELKEFASEPLKIMMEKTRRLLVTQLEDLCAIKSRNSSLDNSDKKQSEEDSIQVPTLVNAKEKETKAEGDGQEFKSVKTENAQPPFDESKSRLKDTQDGDEQEQSSAAAVQKSSSDVVSKNVTGESSDVNQDKDALKLLTSDEIIRVPSRPLYVDHSALRSILFTRCIVAIESNADYIFHKTQNDVAVLLMKFTETLPRKLARNMEMLGRQVETCRKGMMDAMSLTKSIANACLQTNKSWLGSVLPRLREILTDCGNVDRLDPTMFVFVNELFENCFKAFESQMHERDTVWLFAHFIVLLCRLDNSGATYMLWQSTLLRRSLLILPVWDCHEQITDGTLTAVVMLHTATLVLMNDIAGLWRFLASVANDAETEVAKEDPRAVIILYAALFVAHPHLYHCIREPYLKFLNAVKLHMTQNFQTLTFQFQAVKAELLRIIENLEVEVSPSFKLPSAASDFK